MRRGRRNEAGKDLLFEKRSKNFCDFGCALRQRVHRRTKSFLVLFFKKELLPSRMKPARLIAAGFGTGYAPAAPGTAGSLLGLALGAALLAISPFLLAIVTIAIGFGGMPLISAATGIPMRPTAVAMPGEHDDPGWVVIDEIAGQMLALLALPRPSWAGVALAFVLFRLLDITKPGPIGWADRQGGAWGIMADDLIAGFVACLCVGGAHVRWPGIF
jgi:phosphatidylglycerophosphatase A